ncbi:MAG: sigma-70 family RNA polymerase sigma factor [Myxococcota bacterium]
MAARALPPFLPPLAKTHPDDLRLRRIAPKLRVLARRTWMETGRVVERDDLLAAGWLAVALTMDAHDPDICPFEGYATQRARWAMYDLVRLALRRINLRRGAPSVAARGVYDDGARRIGSRSAREAEVTSLMALSSRLAGRIEPIDHVDDVAITREEDPETAAGNEEEAAIVRRAVARLPPRERTVVERHYFGGERFRQIARDLDVSHHAVSRAHRRAMGSLARTLGPHFDCAA